MAGPLPSPVTATEQLLVALHDEVVGLRADLAASRGGEREPDGDSGSTELREPSPAKGAAKKTTPGRRSK